MKKAILVISFGTSHLDTLEKTITAVENRIASEFNCDVFRAFTSTVIINKLKKRDNIAIDTVREALDKLLLSGYTDVFCVPTHIMNGEEYDKACDMINEFTDKMNIKISRPLISITQDYFDIVEIFKKRLSDKSRIYVFMGHGTLHHANSLYAALDYHFKAIGMNNVYVGTVEGYPDIDIVLKQISNTDKKNITLLPLMLVCGDHAKNDMAVEWKSLFEEKGYLVKCDLTGLGEIEEIQNMYISHIKDAI